MTTLEEMAGWAAGLRLGDIPSDVLDLARAQRRSVLAALAASSRDEAWLRVQRAVERFAADGPAVLAGTQRRVRVDDALFSAAAASVALDFDDYLCFGHTGHSAVLVPMIVATETESPGAEQLVAQVAANEIAGRLGGATLLGPQNGQLWSFIHAPAAAVSAGRLLGLDAPALAHAMAIALYQAPRATVPGFMAPDSKLLTAAEPGVSGLRAARLAGSGVTGPLDALEHPEGFLAAFADRPLRGLLGGLGEGWVTRTLCVKPYPGCAYLDTTIDALRELGPPAAKTVERVVVEASLLTCAMDQLSAPYGARRPPTPVTVNFSVPWNVAIALHAGELTPRQVHGAWLAAHHQELADLAARVELRHDWALTLSAGDQFTSLLPPRVLARDAGFAGLRAAVRRAGAHRGAAGHLSSVAGLLQALRGRGSGPRGRLVPDRYWDPRALAGFAMTFPARVTAYLRDGSEVVARADVPEGGAGHPEVSPAASAGAKLAQWGPLLWEDETLRALDDAIGSDARDVWAQLERSGTARVSLTE